MGSKVSAPLAGWRVEENSVGPQFSCWSAYINPCKLLGTLNRSVRIPVRGSMVPNVGVTVFVVTVTVLVGVTVTVLVGVMATVLVGVMVTVLVGVIMTRLLVTMVELAVGLEPPVAR